jgi:ribosome-binding ATPase YchF (GTP1/OBG family)
VRCFDDENVIHVEGLPIRLRDIEIIDIELIMADMRWWSAASTRQPRRPRG